MDVHNHRALRLHRSCNACARVLHSMYFSCVSSTATAVRLHKDSRHLGMSVGVHRDIMRLERWVRYSMLLPTSKTI